MSGREGAVGDELEESMAGFRRKPGGVSARFSAAQAGIVRNLVAQVAELISGPEGEAAGGAASSGQDPFGIEDLAAMLEGAGPTSPPDDPVLARLFPDAYRGDPESAGEFRRFTEQGLRSAKAAAAQTVLGTLPESGGRVRLSEQDAEAWLRALNDVRLALGVRLGIGEDVGEEAGQISVDEARAAYLHVYDWLTFLQETLVRALW